MSKLGPSQLSSTCINSSPGKRQRLTCSLPEGCTQRGFRLRASKASLQAIQFWRTRRRRSEEEKKVKRLGKMSSQVGARRGCIESARMLLSRPLVLLAIVLLTCVCPPEARAASINSSSFNAAAESWEASNFSSPQAAPGMLNEEDQKLRRQLLQRRFFELKQNFETNRAISDEAYYTLLAVYSILMIFGTLSNALICLTVILKPQILSPRNIFIVNLAYSDLLLCVFTMPFSFMEISMKMWHMGVIPCKLVAGLQATSIFVSTISITAIALDRYKVIVYPTHQEATQGSSTRSAILLLVSVWLGALLLSSPLFYYRTVHDETHLVGGRKKSPDDIALEYCVEDWSFKHGRGIYSVISMIVQYVLPISIVSVVYAKISNKLQKRLIRRQRSTQLECQQKRQLNLIKRTHTMLVSVSLIFGLSWLPLNILNVLNDFGTPFMDDVQLFRVVFAVCHVIGCSSACTNPILYAYLNENFRKELRQLYSQRARRLLRLWSRLLRALRCAGTRAGASSSRHRYPGAASSTTLANSTSAASSEVSSPSSPSSTSSSSSSSSSSSPSSTNQEAPSSALEEASSMRSQLNQSPSSATPSSPLVATPGTTLIGSNHLRSAAMRELAPNWHLAPQQPVANDELELTRIGANNNKLPAVTVSSKVQTEAETSQTNNNHRAPSEQVGSNRYRKNPPESASANPIHRFCVSCVRSASTSSSSSSSFVETVINTEQPDLSLASKRLRVKTTPLAIKLGVANGDQLQPEEKRHSKGRKKSQTKKRKRRERCACQCHHHGLSGTAQLIGGKHAASAKSRFQIPKDSKFERCPQAATSSSRRQQQQMGVAIDLHGPPAGVRPNSMMDKIEAQDAERRSYYDQSKRVWLRFLHLNTRSQPTSPTTAPCSASLESSNRDNKNKSIYSDSAGRRKKTESCKHCSSIVVVNNSSIKGSTANSLTKKKVNKARTQETSIMRPSAEGLIEGIQIAKIHEVIPLSTLSMMSQQSYRNQGCGYYLSVETGRKLADASSLSLERSTSFLALSRASTSEAEPATAGESGGSCEKLQVNLGSGQDEMVTQTRDGSASSSHLKPKHRYHPIWLGAKKGKVNVRNFRSTKSPNQNSCLELTSLTDSEHITRLKGSSSLPGLPEHDFSNRRFNAQSAGEFSFLDKMENKPEGKGKEKNDFGSSQRRIVGLKISDEQQQQKQAPLDCASNIKTSGVNEFRREQDFSSSQVQVGAGDREVVALEATTITMSSSRANSSSLYACVQHSSSLSCTCSSCHSNTNSYSNSSNFEDTSNSNLNSHSNLNSIFSGSSWLVSPLEEQTRSHQRDNPINGEGFPQVVGPDRLSSAQVAATNKSLAAASDDSSSLAVLVGSIMRLSQTQQLQHDGEYLTRNMSHQRQLQPQSGATGSSCSVSDAKATPKHPLYSPEFGRKFSSVSQDETSDRKSLYFCARPSLLLAEQSGPAEESATLNSQDR